MLILLAVNLVLGFMVPRVSNSAHIGGLIGGFIATFCFLDRGRFKPDRVSRAVQAGWIAVLVAMIFYVMLPVLRWDYNLKQALRSQDPRVKATYEHAMDADRSLVRALGITSGSSGIVYTGPILDLVELLRQYPHLNHLDEAIKRWEGN